MGRAQWAEEGGGVGKVIWRRLYMVKYTSVIFCNLNFFKAVLSILL